MRTFALASAVALVVLAAPQQARADHKGKIKWVEDAKQGFAQAAATGKPVMLFFTADW